MALASQLPVTSPSDDARDQEHDPERTGLRHAHLARGHRTEALRGVGPVGVGVGGVVQAVGAAGREAERHGHHQRPAEVVALVEHARRRPERRARGRS